MSDKKREDEKPYIKENIVKRRPSPVKFIIRIFMCVVLAAVFGAVAALTFFKIKPLIDKPEVKETSAMTIFPSEDKPTQENTTDISVPDTEESTSIDDQNLGFNQEEREWIKSQIQSGIRADSITLDDLYKRDELLKGVAYNAKKSLVTIHGYVGNDVAWTTQTLAIYSREDNKRIFLLGMKNTIGAAEKITAVLPVSKKEKEVAVMGTDGVFNLEVLALETSGISSEDIQGIQIINIGKNYSIGACDTIMLIGEPYMNKDSVAIGKVTYYETSTAIDSSFRLFATDIRLPQGAMGFAINLSGDFIGVLNDHVLSTVPEGYSAIVGTLNLSDTLNCMCNGKTPSMLGIYGQTVTEELMSTGMPQGVYVTDVLAEGPAYNSGICAGDIITGISQAEITDMNTLSRVLTSNHLPGETVIVTIYREGIDGYKEKTVNVVLGSR